MTDKTSQPTVWTCRKLRQYTTAELGFAALVLALLDRGDLFIA